VRVLIQQEVTQAEFSEMAKRAYVDVAYDNFQIPGRKTTRSRIAVLTGLSRKEVLRLDNLRDQKRLIDKPSPNRAARVVGGWLRDAEFTDSKGRAKVLPLQGDKSSFAALVSKYSGDITLGAVADELERTGVITRDQNTVTLNNIGYLPKDSEIEKIKILAICTADLLETASYNIDSEDSEERFQRQIIFNKMPQSLADEFKQHCADQSTILLTELNRFLLDRQSENTSMESSVDRIGLGVYYVEGLNEFSKSSEEEN